MVTVNPDIGKYWYVGLLFILFLGGMIVLAIEHIILPEILKIIKKLKKE